MSDETIYIIKPSMTDASCVLWSSSASVWSLPIIDSIKDFFTAFCTDLFFIAAMASLSVIDAYTDKRIISQFKNHDYVGRWDSASRVTVAEKNLVHSPLTYKRSPLVTLSCWCSDSQNKSDLSSTSPAVFEIASSTDLLITAKIMTLECLDGIILESNIPL